MIGGIFVLFAGHWRIAVVNSTAIIAFSTSPSSSLSHRWHARRLMCHWVPGPDVDRIYCRWSSRAGLVGAGVSRSPRPRDGGIQIRCYSRVYPIFPSPYCLDVVVAFGVLPSPVGSTHWRQHEIGCVQSNVRIFWQCVQCLMSSLHQNLFHICLFNR